MKRRRLIQRVLIAVSVIALAATITLFITYRRVATNPAVLLDHLQKEADMQLNSIRQTATKNGIREWRLEAETATLLEKKKTVLLERPDVEFFMKDGDIVHLTADQGTIYTDSNRMRVAGNVSANTNNYQFHTETLIYDPDSRQLWAETPVTLTGQSFDLRANTMAMNLETNITQFEGGVEGTISENLQL